MIVWKLIRLLLLLLLLSTITTTFSNAFKGRKTIYTLYMNVSFWLIFILKDIFIENRQNTKKYKNKAVNKERLVLIQENTQIVNYAIT